MLGEIDGFGAQEYAGAGTKLYVNATETKLGVTPSTDGGPGLDSFVNPLVGSGVIAKIGVHGSGTNVNGNATVDIAISALGVDSAYNGNFWRGDLVFTATFVGGTVTLYNAAGVQTSISAQGVRKNGANGVSYTATATVSGNQIFINVSGTPVTTAPVKWQCIGQLQWIQ